MYALFKNDKRISKWHSHHISAAIEAFERKLVVTDGRRWNCPGWLCNGVSIKKAAKVAHC